MSVARMKFVIYNILKSEKNHFLLLNHIIKPIINNMAYPHKYKADINNI